ncbi:MAG: hypothetical protein AAF327_07440 [Cyanobacteria bacterium P01_A01_bin.37]
MPTPNSSNTNPYPIHPPYLRYLNRGILTLIVLEVGLAIAYLSTSLVNGNAPDFLDFNGLRTLPSLIQAFQLFLIGAIALLLLVLSRQLKHNLSWPLLLFITILCCFGGLDEVLKIHLALKQFNWKGMYLGILTAIPILCWKDLVRLWRSHRDVVLWIAIGISVFVAGGFGAEYLKSGLTTLFSGNVSETTLFTLEQTRTTIEELSELIGETITVYGIGRFTIRFIPVRHPSIIEFPNSDQSR